MSSVGSSRSSSTSEGINNDEITTSGFKGSLHNVFGKRKRGSPSPTPSRQSTTSTWTPTTMTSTGSSTESDSQGLPRSASPPQIEQVVFSESSLLAPGSEVQQQNTEPGSASMPPSIWIYRRRSSTRLRDLSPPQSFAPSDLKKPAVLSRPQCRDIGSVSQPHPEPGWRVATKARSDQSVFTTYRPVYSANSHSPLVTGRPVTVYFEGEIRPGSSDDVVCLAMGFVAGRDRCLRMPGSERGSVGIKCCEGRVSVNGDLVEDVGIGEFEPGQRVGIGQTFSVSDVAAEAPVASSSSMAVELFLTRNGRDIGRWNLRDGLRELEDLSLEGLEGAHDLYPAIGTSGEVNVDILFERKYWMYDPQARRGCEVLSR